jgi:hypothetical protein
MVVLLSSNSTVSLELQAAGQADRLVADALHQAAVAGDHPGAVVDDVLAEAGGQVRLGHGHADGGGQALAQRPGGGLHARGVVHFGVARGQRAPLPEVLDLLHRHGLEAGQVQQGIEQHRAVAGRQHEAVAVGPVGLGGVELQELAPQHRGDVGHAHRHALVAGLGLVDGVHGKDADRVGHLDGRNGHGSSVLFLCFAGLREAASRTMTPGVNPRAGRPALPAPPRGRYATTSTGVIAGDRTYAHF